MGEFLAAASPRPRVPVACDAKAAVCFASLDLNSTKEATGIQNGRSARERESERERERVRRERERDRE